MKGQTDSQTTNLPRQNSVPSKNGNLWVQHKQWQRDHLYQAADGLLTPFHPLDIENGPWKQELDTVGRGLGTGVAAAVGAMIGKASPGLASYLATGVLTEQAGKYGSSAGQAVGFLIDNANSVIQNLGVILASPLSSFEDLDFDNTMSDTASDSLD